jgi:hypothetical protein
MNNVAFIVEGLMEKLALQKICKSRTIRLLNCNGDNVKLSAICDRIETIIKVFNNRLHPIIVILDREDRSMTSMDMATEIVRLLRAKNIVDEVIVGIPDRTIENWVLADLDNFKAQMSIAKDICNDNEGCNGKGRLTYYLPRGVKYQETVHGVRLLTTSTPRAMYSNSESFKAFAEQLRDRGCDWLNSCFE